MKNLRLLLLAGLAWLLPIPESDAAPKSAAADHWAFRKVIRPALPSAPSASPRSGHPIDAFIRSRLAAQGLTPALEADRPTLVRRLSLDLTGLLPAPETVDAFLSDPSPDAYERLVDQLLASPQYGERWGRWWLDAARYADSNGYSIDSPRSMWPYRDWVVRALNDDLPFDQFTLRQLAGDLLTPAPGEDASELQIATGFHRNTQVNHEGGIDPEQFRVESVVDRVNTTATVWLGLSLGCAQCHDHKYDPLTQAEYYRFFAFFNQQENDGHASSALEADHAVEIGSAQERAALAEQRAELHRREKELDEWIERELRPRQDAWEASLTDDARRKLKPETLAALAVAKAARNEFQAGTAFAAFRNQDAGYQSRRKAVDAFRRGLRKLPTSLVMKERAEPRATQVMIKGDFTRPAQTVEAGTPAILGAWPGGRTRLDLARWLVSPENPLVARVTVNRIWLAFFGRGLVETENDFGTMGTPPSHPELLDWLAAEFIARGWSLKAMHRLIVTSATYRQSSRMKSGAADPANKWLSRQTRLRLEAEAIRDAHLAASGLLDPRLGGPPVFPPQPAGLDLFTQNQREWKPSTGGDRYRRGLYTWIQRTRFHPALAVFDAPDAFTACTRRLRSNTPLQALTLLNDQAFHELAQGFARRMQSWEGDDAARIDRAFRRCLARSPHPAELDRLTRLLQAERATDPPEARETDAWLAVARVLLNLDETITRE